MRPTPYGARGDVRLVHAGTVDAPSREFRKRSPERISPSSRPALAGGRCRALRVDRTADLTGKPRNTRRRSIVSSVQRPVEPQRSVCHEPLERCRANVGCPRAVGTTRCSKGLVPEVGGLRDRARVRRRWSIPRLGSRPATIGAGAGPAGRGGPRAVPEPFGTRDTLIPIRSRTSSRIASGRGACAACATGVTR